VIRSASELDVISGLPSHPKVGELSTYTSKVYKEAYHKNQQGGSSNNNGSQQSSTTNSSQGQQQGTCSDGSQPDVNGNCPITQQQPSVDCIANSNDPACQNQQSQPSPGSTESSSPLTNLAPPSSSVGGQQQGANSSNQGQQQITKPRQVQYTYR
jgi:hypothetical protein